MVGVVVENVILDLVVGHEAKLAVRTLAGLVVHDSIVRQWALRRPGSKVRNAGSGTFASIALGSCAL